MVFKRIEFNETYIARYTVWEEITTSKQNSETDEIETFTVKVPRAVEDIHEVDHDHSGFGYTDGQNFWDEKGSVINSKTVREYTIVEDEPEVPDWYKITMQGIQKAAAQTRLDRAKALADQALAEEDAAQAELARIGG